MERSDVHRGATERTPGAKTPRRAMVAARMVILDAAIVSMEDSVLV